MTRWAGRRGLILMALPLAATDIFERSDSLKVIGIDAKTLATRVVHLVTVRDWSDVELVEDSMCALDTPVVPNLTVSIE